MQFTHLHTHTEYSLLDGSNKISDYVSRVKELGMDSAAITDHGVMYGVVEFYQACQAQGIRPVIGCEVYVAPGSRFDRETTRGDDRYYHLILLAENNEGYANLVKIVSAGFVDGYYYRPRVDKEILKKYHRGIIASSACLAGEVARLLIRGFYEEAKEAALSYRDIFGEDNYFLELQDHGLPEQKQVNAQLLRMSQETGIPLIATNDCHYTMEEDADAHDILLCIQTGKKLQDEDRMRYEGGQYYVKSPEQMAALFPYALEAVENTHKIAERCNVTIEFGKYKLPKFDVPEGKSAWDYLNELCTAGLYERYSPVTEELKARLAEELEIIRSMGFVDYFLIVWDYVRFARSAGIAVGPGRGSAAGSIVSYCLGITQLDPIRYSLLFERFLNPERISMPDIDIDFAPERRQEVIDYVVRKYGADDVAQIITFGTLQPRGVVRDVGRVMDLPYALCDSISKQIPMRNPVDSGKKMTIDTALQVSRELREMVEKDDRIRTLIDMARKLEGLPRHSSTHAAGVVICQRNVDDFVPLARTSDGNLVTQFTKDTVEALGLLKMDFLGLRTLTVIEDAARLISEHEEELTEKTGHGSEVWEKSPKTADGRLDMNRLGTDDPGVYAYISTGKCDGIFQLESAGMRSFMKQLRPTNLEDVIAGIALYRPGPMNFIPTYIRGKENAGSVHYDAPQLEPILSPTYGCIVYQEQVMQIVRELAGYSYGRSDLVRRAMSKKKASVMAKERENFVYGNPDEQVPGCIARGIDERTANNIFDHMMSFAEYAFNKAHSAAYAVVTYQTAWLKYYYPVEFMAAQMTSVIDNPGKVAEYIMVCRSMGIGILPPDVNESEGGFSVTYPADPESTEKPKIRYALNAIKAVGKPVIDALLAERREGGRFTDLSSFARRMSGVVNRRAAENFIKAGAFDSLGGNRRQMMMVYDQVFDSAAKEKKSQISGQMSLFEYFGADEAVPVLSLPNVEEYDKGQLLSFEKEVLGIYASGHPLEEYENLWRKNCTAVSTEFSIREESGQADSLIDGSEQTIGGIVQEITIKYTKNGQTMAFVTVEDLVGSVEVLVFPRVYDRCRESLEPEGRVFIRGRVSLEDNRPAKLLADRIWTFDEAGAVLWVKFPTVDAYRASAEDLKRLLEAGQGAEDKKGKVLQRVVIFVEDPRSMKDLRFSSRMFLTEELKAALCTRFGAENVTVTEGKLPG